MLEFLIPAAHAEAEAAVAGGGAIGQIVMLVGFVVIFYFLLWRPQSKRAKEHKNLIGNLAKGDEVVIGGGLVGRITKVSEQFITMELNEGNEVNVQKSAVAAVLPKGTIKPI